MVIESKNYKLWSRHPKKGWNDKWTLLWNVTSKGNIKFYNANFSTRQHAREWLKKIKEDFVFTVTQKHQESILKDTY